MISWFLRPFANIIKRNVLLSRVALFTLPDCHIHVKIPQIGRFRVRLRRNRSLWLYPPLRNEWYPLAILRQFVRPGDVVWDVGANLGLYSRWLSQHLNVERVIAFEPMSENLPELRNNLELGGVAGRVTVVPCALSDTDGTVDFQVDDVQSASGAVDAVYRGQAARGRSALGLAPKIEKVRSRTIDGIIAAGDLPAPQVIKVDVEGAERMLLDGGAKFLAGANVRIVIETHGAGVTRQCLEFLFDHGFTVAGNVSWRRNQNMHEILHRDRIAEVQDDMDVHFIAATRIECDMPTKLDFENL